MTTIWKFKLPLEDEPTVDMPIGAKVLSVGVQGGDIVLWALIPKTYASTEGRHFFILGTGNRIPWGVISACPFIGTVQIEPFVWHIFDQRATEPSSNPSTEQDTK